MRGATRGGVLLDLTKRFNPRAPCGARLQSDNNYQLRCVFQSTRPMRGATASFEFVNDSGSVSIHAPHAGRDPSSPMSRRIRHSFNPRAPCGARPIAESGKNPKKGFQSTRPMRGATIDVVHDYQDYEFQSTRPMRGATRPCCCPPPRRGVSIHAPHAGRDLIRQFLFSLYNVSIHAPHAGRDSLFLACTSLLR